MQGGGLQVAAALIVHAIKDPDAESWEFLISSGVAREIAGFGIDPRGPRFHVFDKSPAHNADERKRILRIEAEFQPDLVFTLFGPAYVRFKSPHLCGVADPWVTHSNKIAFKTLGISPKALKKLGLMLWKAYWLKTADYWWTEAPIGRDGLISRLRCPPGRIFVVPNTTGPQFSNREFHPEFPAEGTLQILCLSAYYGHKNLELIPDVAVELSRMRPALDFQFTVTLPKNWTEVQAIMERATQLGVKDRIRNLGNIAVTDTPGLYEKSHLTFLPSLLEVFSAVYAESLCTGVPLVTTDLRFSRDVCRDAAAYFEPTDARSAAEQIVRLAEDEKAWRTISEKGQALYRELPDAAAKWQLQKGMILDAAGRHAGISRP